MKRIIALFAILILAALTVLPALADGYTYNAYWIIEDSDTRTLTATELWGYTRETLRYIRNEILARRGYAFEMAKFYNYFNAKPWYEAGGYGTTKKLTKVEWDNITTVKAVERAMDKAKTENKTGISIDDIIAYQNSLGGYGNQVSYGNNRGGGSGQTVVEKDKATGNKTNPKDASTPATPAPNYIYNTQYIIPDSNTRALTEGELWAYTREALRYIRNELLARHGYIFGDNKFGRYFKPKDWYKEGGFENAILTSTEWSNINLVKKVERQMDALGTQNSGFLDITTIIENQKNNTCPGK